MKMNTQTKAQLEEENKNLAREVKKQLAYIAKLQNQMGNVQLHFGGNQVGITFTGEVGKEFVVTDNALDLLPNDHPQTQFIQATYASLSPEQQRIVDNSQGYEDREGRYNRRKEIRTKKLTK